MIHQKIQENSSFKTVTDTWSYSKISWTWNSILASTIGIGSPLPQKSEKCPLNYFESREPTLGHGPAIFYLDQLD